MRGDFMLDHYDFSNATKNPFAEELNKDRTIIVNDDVADYFIAMSEEKKIPYQTLINLYLADCKNNHRQLTLTWE